MSVRGREARGHGGGKCCGAGFSSADMAALRARRMSAAGATLPHEICQQDIANFMSHEYQKIMYCGHAV